MDDAAVISLMRSVTVLTSRDLTSRLNRSFHIDDRQNRTVRLIHLGTASTHKRWWWDRNPYFNDKTLRLYCSTTVWLSLPPPTFVCQSGAHQPWWWIRQTNREIWPVTDREWAVHEHEVRLPEISMITLHIEVDDSCTMHCVCTLYIVCN